MTIEEKLSRVASYSQELSLDLTREEDRFKWFLAAILFAKRRSSQIAKRSFKEFENEGIVTPESILQAGWNKLADMLDSGGYAPTTSLRLRTSLR